MLRLELWRIVRLVIAQGVVCAPVPGGLSVARGDEGSDWSKPFTPDEHTVVLYHFDEGQGNETHDACGDPALSLRAKEKALWGSRPGFGATVRFERRDANLLFGPADNDKIQLRTCTEEWTIEAWVRYTGPGGKDRWDTFTGRAPNDGHTYANICGTDDEGFGLPHGYRHGWSFYLRTASSSGATREDGLLPGARFLGYHRGKDPNNDTSGAFWPGSSHGWLDKDRGRFRDTDWHHVAWQFRYRGQTVFLYVDGRMIRRLPLPAPGHDSTRIIVNDAPTCGLPFVVGGHPHSHDPPTHFGQELGSMEGEVDELRISSIMRYPVADKLAIIRQKLPEAGQNIPCEVQLRTESLPPAYER